MSWIQVLSVIISLGIAAWTIWKEIRGLEVKIERQGARTDQLYEQFQSCLAEQTARTDRLYEMFIDLVKEGRK